MKVQLKVRVAILWAGPTSPSRRAEEALNVITVNVYSTRTNILDNNAHTKRSTTFSYYNLGSFIRLGTQASIYIATKLLPPSLSLDDPDVPGTRDTLAQARAATLPPSHLGACT